MSYRKKLIEVALPLEAINVEAAREKSIRHGHPSTLHLWWARRPLAACRAVLFSSLVDDPDEPQAPAEYLEMLDALPYPGDRRAKLFAFIEELVKWENSNDEKIIGTARSLILASTEGNPPPVLDPFCGGGSIPLEAQRLGLEAHASDLNPVAVLITKALIEIPPKFAGMPPVNPADRRENGDDGVSSENGGGGSEKREKGDDGVSSENGGGGSEKREKGDDGVSSENGGGGSEKREKGETTTDGGTTTAGGRGDALQGDDCLAEGDGDREGGLSSGAEAAQGRDLRNAVADHPGGRVGPGQHRRGLDPGIEQGEAAVSGNRAGVPCRDGDVADALRGPELVPADRDSLPSQPAGRGLSDSDHNAPQSPGTVASSITHSVASGPSSAVASRRSSAVASGRSSAVASRRSSAVASGPSSAVASRRSSAVASGPSSAVASGRSSAVASGRSSAVASRRSSQSSLLFPHSYRGAQGLAADVRYYGQWMRDEAERRIGHLYPKGPNGETVIAWLWARTVQCPNPACGAQMPLVRSFALSKKTGREVYAEPVVDQDAKTVRFAIAQDEPDTEGTMDRSGSVCLLCKNPVDFAYLREEGKAGRIGAQLMAIVVDGSAGRGYLAPCPEHEAASETTPPEDAPDTHLPEKALGFRVQAYGMTRHCDLFTPRQLVALTTFSDLVGEARERVREDAIAAGLADDGIGIEEGGTGAQAYADAVATYLAMSISRNTQYWSSLSTWHNGRETMQGVFARQAIPMVWDYAEGNVFSSSTGNLAGSIDWIVKVLQGWTFGPQGRASQLDATSSLEGVGCHLIATDPPYYDNIGYADLSDFLYVWVRRGLRATYPALLSTLLTPKARELVATPHRFGGGKDAARRFFETGLQATFELARDRHCPAVPMSVFYAFKQAETETGDIGSSRGGTASTGWETMLGSLMRSGFKITGTWPMRTEMVARALGRVGTNALASSVVLVCRPRPDDAPMATRREFMSALRNELPQALRNLQHGNIAPVDLAQASIGPGMAVFSRYSRVLESDGSAMTVRTALALINQALDEVLAEQEGEFDAETRWAVAWFEQNQFAEGPYGDAETLSKAKNTSVTGMVEAGILRSGGGKVRLLRRDELSADWDPATDKRFTIWEATQHLIRDLEEKGEAGAAGLLRKLGTVGETARDLSYRLYNICERKQWAQEATAYNSLVIVWPEVLKLAAQAPAGEAQGALELE